MEFIETMLVKVKNNKIEIHNYKYHLKRVKKTCEYFKWKKIKLTIPKLNEGIHRVRISYDYTGIKKIELFPIKKRIFKTFKLVSSDINYHFKYADRKKLNNLKKDADEVIIIKNNLVTDTTISNLAFFDGKKWLTPKYPLLKGTKREELIEKNILKEEIIHKYDLKYFNKMAMINSILGFFVIEDFDII